MASRAIFKRGLHDLSRAGVVASISLLSVLATVGAAPAQRSYPDKPIRIVVPYAAGSPIDVVGRKFLDIASGRFKVPVIVDNRTGGSGVLGATEVSRASADGYTLLLTVSDPLIASTVLMKDVAYDPLKDFTFISKTTVGYPVLTINARLGVHTMGELVAAARSKPLSYGSFGPGSFPQIYMNALRKAGGPAIEEIAYRSPPQATQAMLQGEVALGFLNPGLALASIQRGEIVALATIGDRRSTSLPEIPTFAEAGFVEPVLQTPLWVGLLGPKGLPQPIVEKILTTVQESLFDPATVRFLDSIGNVPVRQTPAEFEKQFRAEYSNVIPLIKGSP